MASILIVEDEPHTADTVALFLGQHGHECRVARDGYAGLGLAFSETFEIAIIDWMLPGVDGMTLCERIKERVGTRVILLTARSGVSDRVRGLDAGADDYVVKPFSLRELAARVRCLTRASELREEAEPLLLPLRNGRLIVDTDRHTVRFDGSEILLTPTEFRLLAFMMEQPGALYTRAQLAAVLAPDNREDGTYEVNLHNITTHLSNLRKKLERHTGQPVVKTVYGVGYKLG